MSIKFNLTFKGDKKLMKLLEEAKKNMIDLSPAMKKAALYMMKQTDITFQKHGARGQAKWKDLSPVTKKIRSNKNKKNIKILQDTGVLRASVITPKTANSIYKISKAGAIVGTNLKYAGKHQYGDAGGEKKRIFIPEFKRKSKFGNIHEVRQHTRNITTRPIPQRPFLYFDSKDPVEIGKLIKEYIIKRSA